MSVLARNPQKGTARDNSHETGRGRGKEGPRAVQRRRKTDQSTDQGGQQKRQEQRTGQSTEVRGSRQLSEVDRNKVVSVPCGFVGISLEYTLALTHRSTECLESVTDFFVLAIGANPSP